MASFNTGRSRQHKVRFVEPTSTNNFGAVLADPHSYHHNHSRHSHSHSHQHHDHHQHNNIDINNDNKEVDQIAKRK